MISVATTIAALAACGKAGAEMNADPMIVGLDVHRLEWRADAKDVSWDIGLSANRDRAQWHLASEGEREDGHTADHTLQLYFARPVLPYWNATAGWQTDTDPGDTRHWFAVGIEGLAPYYVEVGARLMAGSKGVRAQIEFEHEARLSLRWSLTSRLEWDWHSRAIRTAAIGEGTRDLEGGLDLRYAVTPQLSFYGGWHYERAFRESRRLLRAAGDHTTESQLVLGISALW